MRPDVTITIAGMAIILFLMRAGGFWLAGRFQPSPLVTHSLELLGGAALVALTVPSVVAAGTPGVLSALMAVVVMRRSGNILLAMALALLTVHLARLAMP
jgi:branched-subunit amino acid transport protein